MAQRKQLSWTELRVGVFVLAGLVILTVAIFYVTGAGFLGPKYRVLTYLPEVDELQTGAPVTLDGIAIGNVESMRLTPHPEDLQHNITPVLRIEKKYQDQIRSSSAATLVTQGLLGDRYVSITRGLTGSVIPANGVVPGGEQADMKAIVQRGADVVENLGVLSAQIGNIIDKVNKGQGTVGKVIASDELYMKVDAAVDKADDVLGAVRDQKGTVGKLIYDPSAYNSVKGVADKGNALLGDVREGKGTLGKLVTDDTLFTNLRDASANVRDASAKLNSTQGTMGKFFTDPAFYDNVTGLTGDLRSLVGEFRQDPKKFLHIKVGIF